MEQLLNFVKLLEQLVEEYHLAQKEDNPVVMYLCEMSFIEIGRELRRLDWSADFDKPKLQ